MKVTEPLEITESMLVSSTVPYPAPGEPAAWASGTAYTVSQRVLHERRIYECVKATAGRAGEAPNAATSADLWKEMGVAARWNMFALDRSTPTTSSSPIDVRVRLSGRVDTVGLFGLQGQSLSLVMRDAGNAVVWRHDASLVRRISARWSDYFFGGFDAAQMESYLRFDLPPVRGATLQVTIGGAGPYGCAALVVGKSYYVGDAQYNAQSDALNFSRMDRKADGTAVLLPRRNVPRVEVKLLTPGDLAPLVYNLRRRLLGRVAIWSGLDDRATHPYFEPVLSLGFARRWLMDLSYPFDFQQTLEIEDF